MRLKENLLNAIYHRAPEHVPYVDEASYRFVDCAGRQPPREGTDEWGVGWAPLPAGYQAGPGEPAQSYAANPAASCLAELLDRPAPDGARAAQCTEIPGDVDPAHVLIIGQHPAGMLDRFVSLLGMLPAMIALVREQVASRIMLERIAAYHVAIAEGYLAAGVEAGWMADDYAGQTGPLLAPPLWRELILPGLRRVCSVYTAAGRPLFFHTCGQASAFVPDLLEAGVTAFNLESAACDLPALKERYGSRIAFWGGLSPELLLRASPVQIRAAALKALDALGREGGLVLGPDQPLLYPPENAAELVAVAREHGRYPLRLSLVGRA